MKYINKQIMKNLITILILVFSIFTGYGQSKGSDYIQGKIITLENETLDVTFNLSKKAFKRKDGAYFKKVEYRLGESDWQEANIKNSKEFLFEKKNGSISRYKNYSLYNVKSKKFYKIEEDGALTLFMVAINGEGSKTGLGNSQRPVVQAKKPIIVVNKTGEIIESNGKFGKKFKALMNECKATQALLNRDKKELLRKYKEAKKKKGFNPSEYAQKQFIKFIKMYNENCGS